jgi:tetratricopeptide (TPR) repeat protein
MKKILPLIFIVFSINSFAQQSNLQSREDSVLKIIPSQKTPEEICNSYLAIAWIYAGQNKEKETEYFSKTIFTAEQTRDKKLIAIIYKKIADQWLSLGSMMERQNNALVAIDKGLAVAKQAQLNEETASLTIKKAYTYRIRGKLSEALKLNEEAVNYADLSDNDSLKIAAQLSYANTLLAKDENLTAFKKYMLALNMAETVDQKPLTLALYERVANFYKKIDQAEKAKDYYIKGINLSKKINDSTVLLSIYTNLINLYVSQKDFAMAREYLKILYDKGKKSEIFKQYAISAESGIIAKEDINKLPEFIKKNSMLIDEYAKYNMFFEMHRIKSLIFSVEKRFDSALHYITLAKSEFNPKDINAQANWNETYAYYLEKNNQFNEAASYIEQNVLLAKNAMKT